MRKGRSYLRLRLNIESKADIGFAPVMRLLFLYATAIENSNAQITARPTDDGTLDLDRAETPHS
jgi:hypothetical protein